MITSLSKNYFLSALTFIFVGILLGNMIFVYMGLLPIIILLTGLVFTPPTRIKDVDVEAKENVHQHISKIVDKWKESE